MAHRLKPGNGRGLTIALVHGMADSWHSWRDFAQQSDGSWQVFALDLPWRLNSRDAWSTSGSPAAWVARAVDSLPARPDVLVGHSFGANALLQLLAEASPCLAKAVVLLAPGYILPEAEVQRPVAEQCHDLVRELLRDLMWEEHGSDGHGRVQVEAMADLAAKRLWAQSSSEIITLAGGSGGLHLRHVRVPTLIIGDRADPALAFGRAQRLLQAMPHAQLVLKDCYGHFFHRRRADAVVDDIHRFVTRAFPEHPPKADEGQAGMGAHRSSVCVRALSPRWGDVNFATTVGYRGVSALGEEAVGRWFRARDLGPQRLYESHGLAVRVVRSSVQPTQFTGMDDELEARVEVRRPGEFAVRLTAQRDGKAVPVMTGRYDVVLTRCGDRASSAPPDDLLPPVSGNALPPRGMFGGEGLRLPIETTPDDALAVAYPAATRWPHRIAFQQCCYSRWLQHDACLTLLEESDSRFRFERNIPYARSAAREGQAPVVTTVRCALTAPAFVDEPLYICYQPTAVFQAKGYDARMDCFVERDGFLVDAVRARLSFACAEFRDERPLGLCDFNATQLKAVRDALAC
ncbi:alpha/beta fold hydrolase [Streptomyces sp. NPDC001719]